MTLVEQRREAVLRLRDQGLAEDEIADQVGISEADVMRILDREEPPPIPYREPVVTPKIPKVRSVHRLPFPGKEQPQVSAETLLRSARQPRAEHGTESAYRRHRRHGEPACPACSAAASVASQERKRLIKEKARAS